MKTRILTLGSIVAATVANGALYNLTDSTFQDTSNTYAPDTITGTSAVIIDSVLFQRGATNSGSGTFRDLFRFSAADNPDGQQGYNRDSNGGLDESFIGGPAGIAASKIQVQDLVLDASGNNYVFLLDVNKNQQSYASIDEVKIWVDPSSGANDNPDGVNGGPYPSNLTDLETALGVSNLIYDLDGSEDNAILYDGAIQSGSGSSDVVIFVPTSLFSGYAADDHVYLYMQMDAYVHSEDLLDVDDGNSIVDITSDNGNEESVAIPADPTEVFTAIPEPGSTTLLLLAAGLGLGRRRRS